MSDDATRLNEETTRLNIDQARAALARARMDEAAAAVRSPRPADLSRLQEDQARADTLNTRVTAFRDTVRSQLGLGDYTGPMTASNAGNAMTAPLCDAEICAPVAPMMKAPVSEHADTVIRDDAAAPETDHQVDKTECDMDPVAGNSPQKTDTPPVSDLMGTPPMPEKRKKFLGLF